MKERCDQTAFEYLIEKVNGKKGRNIEYKSLKKAEFLLPEGNFSLKDQWELFSVVKQTWCQLIEDLWNIAKLIVEKFWMIVIFFNVPILTKTN